MPNPAQPNTLPPSYFDAVYRADPDPWGFQTKPYEAAKYDDTLASLPRARYRDAVEIGCSLGVLTARLAERCEALLAVDPARQPLERARERCRSLPHVRFERMQVPQQFPPGAFDLILLSEVGYYWSPADLALAQGLIVEALALEGQLMLVHYTPWVHDYPLTGDEVHESFLSLPGLRHLHGHREPRYRLDLLERA